MSQNQSGYIKFLVLFLILPLLALVFLKPPLTPNPKVDYGACSGSLAANKSFRFDFATNGLRSNNGQQITPPGSSTDPYGLIQFNNSASGIQNAGTTDPSTLTCNGANCRFINLDTDPANSTSPYKQINNQVFRLFKENNLVPKAEFPWHLGWIGQVSLPDEPSKKRNVWIVLTDCHGNRRGNVTDGLCAVGTDNTGKPLGNGASNDPNKVPSAAGWDDPSVNPDSTQPAFFLLYVQKDTPQTYGDDFLNFDLYYKVGNDGELDLTRDLPKFIQNFCKNSEPIVPLSIVQTGPQTYNPPKTLNLANITQGTYTRFTQNRTKPLECPGDAPGTTAYPDLNKNFKLVLYTKFGGTVTTVQSVNSAASPQSIFCGQYTLKNNSGTGSADDLNYYVGLVSFAKFITLTDTKLNYTYYYLPDNTTTAPGTTPTTPRPNQNLQLTTFNLDQVLPWGWWIPECKPAIYLYPTKTQQVNVKVTPKGYLTYTDPPYPISSGWQVEAHPNGQIIANQKSYPYLYYESKIHDERIDKPISGYISSWTNLPETLNNLLPKLGLSSTETHDFVEYWTKSLHQAPYYYIGVLSDQAINTIEPLSITPKPDTTIRVRLYFKALDNPITVSAPTLPTLQTRSGFTAVEWGGLVKNDLNHPFTCSQ